MPKKYRGGGQSTRSQKPFQSLALLCDEYCPILFAGTENLTHNNLQPAQRVN